MENPTQRPIAAWIPKSLATMVTLPILAFSAFGFLATFEGSDTAFIAFRFFYAILFCGLCGLLNVVWRLNWES